MTLPLFIIEQQYQSFPTISYVLVGLVRCVREQVLVVGWILFVILLCDVVSCGRFKQLQPIKQKIDTAAIEG